MTDLRIYARIIFTGTCASLFVNGAIALAVAVIGGAA